MDLYEFLSSRRPLRRRVSSFKRSRIGRVLIAIKTNVFIFHGPLTGHA